MRHNRMMVTVLCGVSGCGKTRKRTQPDSPLDALPYLDIADIYTELEADTTGLVFPDYSTAMVILIDRIVEHNRADTEHLVVEGYFLPGTPSRSWLTNACMVQGIDVMFDLLWAPLKVCAARLHDQFDALDANEQERQRHKFNKRHDLLIKCWRPQ